MVEHHVEEHFDASRVHGLDEGLELRRFRTAPAVSREPGLRGEERQRLVPPQVEETCARDRIGGRGHVVLVEIHDGQQLDRRDAKPREVRNFLDQPGIGARRRHPRTGMPRESTHVQLVDYGRRKRRVRMFVGAPVEPVGVNDAGAADGAEIRRLAAAHGPLAPRLVTRDRAGVTDRAAYVSARSDAPDRSGRRRDSHTRDPPPGRGRTRATRRRCD